MIKLLILLSIISLCSARLDEFPNVDTENTCFGSKYVKIPSTMNDKFTDLLAIAQGRVDNNTPINHDKVVIYDKLSADNPSVGDVLGVTLKWHSSNMEEFFYKSIKKSEMYGENDKVVKKLLNDYAKESLIYISPLLKRIDDFEWTLWFGTSTSAVFRPERMGREDQTHPDHFYYDEFPKHNANIAAYHLDRLLGFRRAPPAVGRKFHIMGELFDLMDHNLMEKLYVSPKGNVCMYSRCRRYCDTYHAVCGNPDTIESSLSVNLRLNDTDHTKKYYYPWKRSFDYRKKALWEVDDNYCDSIKSMNKFKSGRRLLDMMDLAIIDFLIGNMNRKSYEIFKFFGNESFTIHSEFSRSFGRAYHDEVSILAPVKQCCMIRSSTLNTLLKFHNGPKKLSAALRESLAADPLSPILWEPHIEALDRRVAIVLETVRNCLKK